MSAAKKLAGATRSGSTPPVASRTAAASKVEPISRSCTVPASAIVAARSREKRNARLEILRSYGIRGHAACTGTEILALTALESPDLVLLDVELAGEDGAETCRRLKSDEAFTLPVVLCLPHSASAFRKQSAVESGADAWLSEPVEPEVLTALARALLRVSKANREIRHATETVEKLQKQLRQTQEENDQFASHACHDVEEFLRGVSTFVQLIDERHTGILSEDERSLAKHVLGSGNRLRGLVRGFLSYSQSGRVPRGRFGPVDLRMAVAGAVWALDPLVQQMKAGIQIDEPLPTVLGDFAELQQVFVQVIGNAVAYSRGLAAPSIRIGAEPSDSGEAAIFVADNGPGVPPDLHAAIFQPFRRLHGREIPGAGLGLPIAKRIVESHGGRIWVESDASTGSRLWFTLSRFDAANA